MSGYQWVFSAGTQINMARVSKISCSKLGENKKENPNFVADLQLLT